MRVITGGRGAGKTAAMLAWMRAAPEGEHRVCVCISAQEAMRLLRENPDLESWQFVGPDEPKDGAAWSGVRYGRGGRIVLGYDNLDILLQQQSRFEVAVVSITTSPYDVVDAAVDAISVPDARQEHE